ncbi:MAG: cell wall anchor protein, partial [Muribaculum sp.]|nr:cell wall anchor protein [Muribaculum sp.]
SEPVLPPYELAVKQLNELKSEKLCENSREKEYYTRLTDILRIYLETRFGINAMEMTSTQIMRSVRSHDTTKPSAALMKQILEIADFVKFAKVRPLPDDNVKSFNQALQFVEATRPEPETAESTDSTDADNQKNVN